MEEGRRHSGGIRILMFPWLAHGHISPFVELANKIISLRPNFVIQICSSPINLDSIRETHMIKHPSQIKLIDLHLPSLPDLPPHSHTTKGLPRHLIPTLLQAMDTSTSQFSDILTEFSPDLLISDFFQPWAPKLALSLLKIPTVCFMTCAAFPIDTMLTSMDNSGKFDGFFPLRSNHVFDSDELDSPPSLRDRYFGSLERSSTMLLIKSFRDIEAEHIDRVSKFVGKSIVTVAPLVPDDDDDQESDNEIIDWLNKKAPSSVVYISFGSECYLSRSEMQELAHALLIILVEKACPVNFVWVLRFPRGEEVGTLEALPEGFAEAVGEKVYVADDWAPQRRILRHGSVGGFVSHCGWSSVMEGMKYGVPIVGVPLRTDQPVNAMLVEEVGFGLKVEKIERGELAKVIEQVWRNGSFKNKAKEISDCLTEKGDHEIDEAIERLVHLCKTFKV
ncbi:UDP-glucosyltransferase 29 [Linum perenne]